MEKTFLAACVRAAGLSCYSPGWSESASTGPGYRTTNQNLRPERPQPRSYLKNGPRDVPARSASDRKKRVRRFCGPFSSVTSHEFRASLDLFKVPLPQAPAEQPPACGGLFHGRIFVWQPASGGPKACHVIARAGASQRAQARVAMPELKLSPESPQPRSYLKNGPRDVPARSASDR